jgi:hypothetical protein
MNGLSGLACNDDRCTVIVSDQADETGYEPVGFSVGRSSRLATIVAGLLGRNSAQLHRSPFAAAAGMFHLQHRHIVKARIKKAQNDADVVEWVPWNWGSVCPVCRLPLRSDAKVRDRVYAFKADRRIRRMTTANEDVGHSKTWRSSVLLHFNLELPNPTGHVRLESLDNFFHSTFIGAILFGRFRAERKYID